MQHYSNAGCPLLLLGFGVLGHLRSQGSKKEILQKFKSSECNLFLFSDKCILPEQTKLRHNAARAGEQTKLRGEL